MSRLKKAGRWSTLGSMDALAIRGAAYELEIIDKEQTPHMRYMRKWRRKGIRICSPHTISARLPCDEVQIVCSGCPGLEMRDGIEPPSVARPLKPHPGKTQNRRSPGLGASRNTKCTGQRDSHPPTVGWALPATRPAHPSGAFGKVGSEVGLLSAWSSPSNGVYTECVPSNP